MNLMAEQKVRMALAEVGYGSARVVDRGMTLHGNPKVGIDAAVPAAVAYRAYVVVGEWDPMACFECWMSDDFTATECRAGRCKREVGS